MGLSIEVEFLPVHRDQPVFSDVDLFMRQMGFWLYDLATYRHARKSLRPNCGIASVDCGQIIWGQALYLRDGVSEIGPTSSSGDSWDDTRVLKLASIMELHCLYDCAIELIQVGHGKGLLQGWNVGRLVDLLVPELRGKNVSYNEYLQNVEPRKIPLPVRRIFPRSVRRMVHRHLRKLRDLVDEII